MLSSDTPTLLDDLTRRASDEGLDLVGLVGAEEFDGCQPPGRRAREIFPSCGTIVVLASGGRSFWDRTWSHRPPPARPARCASTVAQRCAAVVGALRQRLAAHGHDCRALYPSDRPSLNFPQMGEMAGLGTVSPVLGVMLHPEYGLWINFRAALLVAGTPFGTAWPAQVPSSFQPCATCARPCVRACPAEVFDEAGGARLQRCAEHRAGSGCAHGCDVLRACPVGAAHRDAGGEAGTGHALSYAAMQRHYGLGPWRLVPRPLRAWLC